MSYYILVDEGCYNSVKTKKTILTVSILKQTSYTLPETAWT